MEELINVIVILIPPFVVALWITVPVALVLLIVRLVKKRNQGTA